MSATHLPNRDRAVVPERKVIAYLLSESHPDGRGKARFFFAYGFSITRWQELAEALRRHAAEHAVVETIQTAFGVRYVVEGALSGTRRTRAGRPRRVVR